MADADPPSDESDYEVTVRIEGRRIVMQFSSQIMWVAWSPEEAMDLGKLLLEWGARLTSDSRTKCQTN